MSATQTVEPTTTEEVPEIAPQTAEMIVSLATRARALRWGTLMCAATVAASGVIVWLFTYAGYVFDSFTSFTVCSSILVALLLPGAFLFWVYRSLLGMARLPRKFNLPSQLLPSESSTSGNGEPPPAESSKFARWLHELQVRLKPTLELWESLEYFAALDSVGGPRVFLRFLSQSWSQIAVGIVLLASTFLLLAAVYDIVVLVLRAVL